MESGQAISILGQMQSDSDRAAAGRCRGAGGIACALNFVRIAISTPQVFNCRYATSITGLLLVPARERPGQIQWLLAWPFPR